MIYLFLLFIISFLAIIIFFRFIIAIIVLSQEKLREEREAYGNWAQLHGWSYSFERDYQTYRRYSFLRQLQTRLNGHALDILQGAWEKYSAEAFNFYYTTSSSSTSMTGEGCTTTTITHDTHYIGVVLIHIERDFPRLLIFPQSIFGKISNALGFVGIKFQSVEFSKRFTVRCDDKKFAYDFCHSRMINYLLANLEIEFEFELNGNIAALCKTTGKMTPYEIEQCLVQLCQLRRLMPGYLFRY